MTQYLTAWDVRPGQRWRLEVALPSLRRSALVERVQDGTVWFEGGHEPVPVGSLLAYWRRVR